MRVNCSLADQYWETPSLRPLSQIRTCDHIDPRQRVSDERATLSERNAPLGLVIAPGSIWTDIVADLPRFPVIAVTIPKYADGRAFSIARLLRDRDGYAGEIRAIGDYIIDQMPYMKRVGIDAFVIDNPIVEAGLKRGLWPEVTDYTQPAIGNEIPAGTRPWTRKRGPAG